MEWQLLRPAAGRRTLWWSLTDTSRATERGPGDSLEHNTRVRPDGAFPAAMDGRAPVDEAEHEAECIWHHDATEYMCAPSCRGPQSQLSRVLAAAAVFLPLPHRAPSPPAAA